MGIKSLRKLQMGFETTPGTLVAATSLWRGMGVLNDAQELQFVEEDIGVLSQPDSAYIPKLEAGVELEEVDCSFEQLPYILSAGIKQLESGVADGAGSGYIYDYPMPMASANTISSLTFEGGDDAGAEVVEYCYVKEFKITGKAGEAIKMSATLGGRQAVPQAFTGSISIPTTEIALFSAGKFYCDDAGSSFGTTQRTQTLLSFELTVTTGWIPRWTCDGTKYFTFIRSTRPEIKLALTYEHNAFAIAEKAKMRAVGGTLRKFRLLVEGSDLATAGTYSKKTLIIDLCGKYIAVPAMEDEDGDNVLSYDVTGIYSASESAYMDIKVVNELSALP